MTSEAFIIACATCANTFEEAGGNAAGWAIMFMVAIIMPMAAGVIFLLARIARREAAALDPQFRDPSPDPPRPISS
jgi:predicted metal-binding membrane protein